MARRRDRKVRTVTAWGAAVTELLSLVDQMDRKNRNGRDPGLGARPQRTTEAWTEYAPQQQPIKS